jgi:uncharacterized membrane protein YgdD (TMEM256/DUF423 family)
MVPMIENKILLKIAAIFGFFGVALGAFGAHGLKTLLENHGMLDTWKTASLYHLIHAVVLLWVSQFERRWTFAFLATGILFFSGSLYAMALTGFTPLGKITPFGGVFLLIGWTLLFFPPNKK